MKTSWAKYAWNFFFVPLVLILVLIAVYEWILRPAGNSQTAVTTSGEAAIGSEFTLTNHNGETISSNDFQGKYMWVYFGFSHCPDICPVDLMTMTTALNELGEDAEQIQPIFITVDPERDTPERLKTFASNFHPRLQALTGEKEKVLAVANAYKVYYKKQGELEDEQGYGMDHSGYSYLMDKEGRYLTHYRHGDKVEDVVESLRGYL